MFFGKKITLEEGFYQLYFSNYTIKAIYHVLSSKGYDYFMKVMLNLQKIHFLPQNHKV